MKTINSKKFKYLGTSEDWHVFESVLEDFDPERVYVKRARYVMPDGSSVFFDPIRVGHSGVDAEWNLQISTPESRLVSV